MLDARQSVVGLRVLASLLGVAWAGGFGTSTGYASTLRKPDQEAAFFVAVDGNDAWSGRLAAPNTEKTDGPFATLAKARDALRQVKGKQPGALTVMVRGGKHYLAETLVLGPQDSGTTESPVIFTAYPGEKPALSGGRRVTGWRPYKDKILQCSVAEARGGKWKFRQLFYNGRPQIRARTPDFDPKNPVSGGWAAMEGPAQPGRYNAADVARGATASAGEMERLREPGGYIAFKYKPGTFQRHWAKPTEGEVTVFVGYDWFTNVIPIKTVDEQNRAITLVHGTTDFVNHPPCPLPYSFAVPFYPGKRFRVENVLEELDQPGEWCWDSGDGKLYFWPPEEGVEKAEVVIPVLDSLIALRGAAHVTVSGLTLTETNGGDNFHPEGAEGVGAMFPMPGWKYCGDAVLLEGAERCRIEDNHFLNIGGNAVYLKGPSARNLIRRNEISRTGACGVSLAGKQARAQYPVFNEVVHNRIHHTGVLNTYSAGVFLGLSEGNVIGHNAIHDVPHHAVNLGNSGRSRNIIEYNEIRDTCLETSDTGAINCWMEETEKTAMRQGHIIRCNLVVDSRGHGIYVDNYTSNCLLYGNVIVRPASGYGILVNSGKNNVVENNVIVDAGTAIAIGSWNDSFDWLVPQMRGFQMGNRFCRNIVFGAKAKEPVVMAGPNWTPRSVAQVDYNLIFNAPNAESYLRDWRKSGLETHSLIADPLFVDPAHGNYRLKPESPAFQLGFQAIDFARIGPGSNQ